MNCQCHLSRREFLQRAALSASALVLEGTGVGSAGTDEAVAPPVAVFSKVYQELKLDFEQAAEVTALAGLDGIDCPVRPGGEIPPERAQQEMPRYAEALRKRRVRMLLITTGILGVSSPHAEGILRAAKSLGIRYYRLGSDYHRQDRPLAAQVNDMNSRLRDLAALNRELGVCAMIQNHSPGGRVYFGGDLGELYDLVKDFDPDQIGVAFDLGHALIVHGEEWPRHFERLKAHIKVAYIKDVKRPRQWVPFGQGDFSGTDYFRRLKTMNYCNPYSMHLEYEWAGRGQSKTQGALVEALRNDLRVLKQWVAAA